MKAKWSYGSSFVCFSSPHLPLFLLPLPVAKRWAFTVNAHVKYSVESRPFRKRSLIRGGIQLLPNTIQHISVMKEIYSSALVWYPSNTVSLLNKWEGGRERINEETCSTRSSRAYQWKYNNDWGDNTGNSYHIRYRIESFPLSRMKSRSWTRLHYSFEI